MYRRPGRTPPGRNVRRRPRRPIRAAAVGDAPGRARRRAPAPSSGHLLECYGERRASRREAFDFPACGARGAAYFPRHIDAVAGASSPAGTSSNVSPITFETWNRSRFWS